MSRYVDPSTGQIYETTHPIESDQTPSPATGLDPDKFTDHTYWLEHKAKIAAAFADGSLDDLYRNRNH